MPLIFDIETQKPVPPKDGVWLSGIQYCKSWGDYLGMGIAVLAAYEYNPVSNNVLVFGASDIQDFQAVIDRADSIVTYNGHSFDCKLLAAHGVTVPREKSLDLCELLRQQTSNRYKLGDIAETNFNEGKIEDGALAPVLWQRGEKFRVIRYCLSDVKLTTRLYRLFLKGSFICPKLKQELPISLPDLFREVTLT